MNILTSKRVSVCATGRSWVLSTLEEHATDDSAWALKSLEKMRPYSTLARRIHVPLENLGYLCSGQSSHTGLIALFLALAEQQRTPLESQKQDDAASVTVRLPNKYLWLQFAVPWPTSAVLTMQISPSEIWMLKGQLIPLFL